MLAQALGKAGEVDPNSSIFWPEVCAIYLPTVYTRITQKFQAEAEMESGHRSRVGGARASARLRFSPNDASVETAGRPQISIGGLPAAAIGRDASQ